MGLPPHHPATDQRLHAAIGASARGKGKEQFSRSQEACSWALTGNWHWCEGAKLLAARPPPAVALAQAAPC